ncbi:MAG: hypothetical protein RIA62_18055 [Cyclobacteriaceae bacterium]
MQIVYLNLNDKKLILGRFIIISLFFLMLSSCGSNNAKLEAELVEMKKIVEQAQSDAEHSAAEAIRVQAMAEAKVAEALRAAKEAEERMKVLEEKLKDCMSGN